MVPGIIAMILTVITTMLTAMGITCKKERGTFEQLVVSSIRGWELMLGMGLFISTISQTQQQTMMTVFAVLFPVVVLSDFFFPLENMPQAVQYGTLLNPMPYALRAQREIFLKGSGWEQVWPNILVLTGFADAFLSYGSLRFRKSQQV